MCEDYIHAVDVLDLEALGASDYLSVATGDVGIVQNDGRGGGLAKDANGSAQSEGASIMGEILAPPPRAIKNSRTPPNRIILLP